MRIFYPIHLVKFINEERKCRKERCKTWLADGQRMANSILVTPLVFTLDFQRLLEGELLHKQVHVLVDLEAVKIIGITLQPHQ